MHGRARSRKSKRRRLDILQGLTLSQRSRNVAATLVDVSDGGIGLDTFVRCEAGSTVRLEGELVREDLGPKLDGHARVAHSNEIEPGRYRVGLEFVEVAYARAS